MKLSTPSPSLHLMWLLNTVTNQIITVVSNQIMNKNNDVIIKGDQNKRQILLEMTDKVYATWTNITHFVLSSLFNQSLLFTSNCPIERVRHSLHQQGKASSLISMKKWWRLRAAEGADSHKAKRVDNRSIVILFWDMNHRSVWRCFWEAIFLLSSEKRRSSFHTFDCGQSFAFCLSWSELFNKFPSSDSSVLLRSVVKTNRLKNIWNSERSRKYSIEIWVLIQGGVPH